jgi:hypothetical protein
MAREFILGTLVPFEADQGHRSEMWFARLRERSVQGVGLLTRGRLCRTASMLQLNSAEWVLTRHRCRLQPPHRIPRTRNSDHAQIGLPKSSCDTLADLKFLIELVDARALMAGSRTLPSLAPFRRV